MCIFADGLEFQNIIALSTEASTYTPYCYAHICTSEVYIIIYIIIASREYHCVVALQGDLGLPCSYI